jgi:phage-related minor tail protein
MIEIDGLEAQVAQLEATLGGTGGMVATFAGELSRMRESLSVTGREVNSLSSGLGSGLRKAFEGLVFDGEKASDVLKRVGLSLSTTFFNAAMRPVQNALGGLISSGFQSLVGGMTPFADGGAFSQGRVMPFAKGGVVSSPVGFPMRGGRGLMGEAGPEAIMPLARGPDGRLGVQAAGGGRPVTVVMNVATPDVQGFQRSQGQIAAQAARALARGQRNK